MTYKEGMPRKNVRSEPNFAPEAVVEAEQRCAQVGATGHRNAVQRRVRPDKALGTANTKQESIPAHSAYR